ncbi:hypothetical protein CMT41_11025 [Colwellia sp. MT41]|nr:hypothetical protein CMT41_11025 [Colwellia sp. MT41]
MIMQENQVNKTTKEWCEIYDKKKCDYPEWLKEAVANEQGSLDSWLDNERSEGNTTEEDVYLGDGIYM